MSDDVIRVLLADDHLVVRAGLRALLGATPDLAVASEASSGEEAVALAARVRPDVAIVDVAMPGLDGIAACAEIRRVSPGTRVLILSAHEEERYLLPALSAGAAGYVRKSVAASELVDAVRAVARGDSWVQPSAAHTLARHVRDGAKAAARQQGLESLSSRERDVLRYIAAGHSAAEAATQLGISPRTVETYRQRVSAKLGITHRADFLSFALQVGLLDTAGVP